MIIVEGMVSIILTYPRMHKRASTEDEEEDYLLNITG